MAFEKITSDKVSYQKSTSKIPVPLIEFLLEQDSIAHINLTPVNIINLTPKFHLDQISTLNKKGYNLTEDDIRVGRLLNFFFNINNNHIVFNFSIGPHKCNPKSRDIIFQFLKTKNDFIKIKEPLKTNHHLCYNENLGKINDKYVDLKITDEIKRKFDDLVKNTFPKIESIINDLPSCSSIE